MGVVRRFVGALLLCVVVLAAVGFATDRAASVVTNGVSMQPGYRAGDLVVVARAARYRTGDVVAYREPDSQEVVLHRIVGGDARAFDLKGDNNTSIDTATPGADGIIGREVLHVPKVGRWIGSPLAMACVAGLLIGLLSLVTVGGGSRRRARAAGVDDPATGRGGMNGGRGVEQGDPHVDGPHVDGPHVDGPHVDGSHLVGPRNGPSGRWRWWHGLLLVLNLSVTAGLVAAYLVPPTVVPPPPAALHVGSLSYTAEVPTDDTYPDGVVRTGDTVFLRLVDRIDVAFTYDGDPDLEANARLRATVASASGWATTVMLAPLTPVVAGGVDLLGTLDLAQLRSLLTRVNDATGIPLTTVEIRVQGIVEPVTDDPAVTSSTTEMLFRFDDIVADFVDTTEVTESLAGRAVVTSSPVRDFVLEATEVGGVPREARRWLIVALLVLVAASATAWPSGERRRGRAAGGGHDPVPVTVVADLELPPTIARVRLAARSDLEQLARATGARMLVRHDGWCAVVDDRVVHWWSPGVDWSPGVASAPAVAEAAVPPGLEPIDVPTIEMRIDVVERLRDDVFAPRRPLFASRAGDAPRASPGPVTNERSAAERSAADDPLRTTIDEIVAFLSEVAPRP